MQGAGLVHWAAYQWEVLGLFGAIGTFFALLAFAAGLADLLNEREEAAKWLFGAASLAAVTGIVWLLAVVGGVAAIHGF